MDQQNTGKDSATELSLQNETRWVPRAGEFSSPRVAMVVARHYNGTPANRTMQNTSANTPSSAAHSVPTVAPAPSKRVLLRRRNGTTAQLTEAATKKQLVIVLLSEGPPLKTPHAVKMPGESAEARERREKVVVKEYVESTPGTELPPEVDLHMGEECAVKAKGRQAKAEAEDGTAEKLQGLELQARKRLWDLLHPQWKAISKNMKRRLWIRKITSGQKRLLTRTDQDRMWRLEMAMLLSEASWLVESSEKRIEAHPHEKQKVQQNRAWMLKYFDELISNVVCRIWKADRLQADELWGARVQYLEGWPLGLEPVVPRVTPTRWRSRRNDVAIWSPCAQCETVGDIECSSARFLPLNFAARPCHRCRRLGLTCVRVSPDFEHFTDEHLSMIERSRWQTYYAADGMSLDPKEAHAVAEKLLTKRGQKLINVCGTMVDTEDVKNFAPRMLTLENYLRGRPGGEDRDEKRVWVSPFIASRAKIFEDRMPTLKSEEYWQEKAERFGHGMNDWSYRAEHVIPTDLMMQKKPIPGKVLGM